MKYSLLLLMLTVFAACHQQSNNIETTKDSGIKHETAAVINDSINSINKDSVINTASSANKLIVAGKSIGNIELEMDDSKLEAFGKPDMSDAAMGKAWLTWYGKKADEHNNKTQLNVYTAYKDTSMRSKTVQQIRTTSSFFSTAGNVHVYTSLNNIQQQYPKLKKVATYTDDGRLVDVYDAQQQGIAFEIVKANDQQICTGIIIHKPGVKVTQVYLSLHPDMHIQ